MKEDGIHWVYSHYDRYMVAGVVPVNTVVALETVDALKSENFLDRRELGIINVGNTGIVLVDGTEYILNHNHHNQNLKY